MVRLHIRHVTTYRYGAAVNLGPHRLMLRPRESRDVRLLALALTVEPQAELTWMEDVAGNAVATATFATPTSRLHIESRADVELAAKPWPVFPVAASALSHPFSYDADEAAALGTLAQPQYADAGGQLRRWVSAFPHASRTDTLSLLKDINAGIPAAVGYHSRDAEGTQTPAQTLARGWGSCRDLAVLFAEAVRTLGFGARIVSGYLHNPDFTAVGTSGAGSTHAWAEVYVPGAGWIAFDPTNNGVGGLNLVPVAVGADIRHVMPVTGSVSGAGTAGAEMTVEVRVTRSGV